VSAISGRVLAIGFAVDDGSVQILHGNQPGDEERILIEFWRLWSTEEWANSEVVGFNIISFDLAFLQRRSWHHGIKVPADLIYTACDRKWVQKRILDLMVLWKCGDYKEKFITLDRLARFMGIPGKDGLDGGLFGYAYQFAREQALAYLHNDVIMLQKCADIML
jgi:predicted PolB exonuclease-like 3'-5' exonuclease